MYSDSRIVSPSSSPTQWPSTACRESKQRRVRSRAENREEEWPLICIRPLAGRRLYALTAGDAFTELLFANLPDRDRRGGIRLNPLYCLVLLNLGSSGDLFL